MVRQEEQLRVTMTPDGFYAQSFRWMGRTVRVLHQQAMQTRGLERHFLVQTAEGRFELSYHIGTGLWQMRHTPTWIGRAWAQLQKMPRYPLPVNRRRGYGMVTARQADPAPTAPVAVQLGQLALARR